MNKTTLLSIGWPATMVGAFMVGKMSTTKSAPNDGQTAANIEVKTVERTASSGFNTSLSTGQSPEQLKKNIISIARASNAEFDQNYGIAKIMEIDDPIKRSTLLLGVLENMSDEEFEQVVDDFRKLGITRSRMTEYEQLLTAWAQRNPIAALEYSQENTGSDVAENVILTTWAKSNPSAAIEWAKANHEGDGANPFMIGVIKGVASTDHVLATELLNEMPYSEERGEALDEILDAVNQMETAESLAWLETLSDERLKAGATSRLVRELAKSDPKGMAEWVTQLEDETARNRSIRSVADSWANKDAGEAKEWVATLEPEQQMVAARGMINDLAREDAGAAAEWMNTMKEQDGYQDLLRSYIWSAATSRQPAEALAQVPNMASEDSQRQVYQRTLHFWSGSQPEEVEKWLPTSSVPEDIKKTTMDRIAKVKSGEITPRSFRGRDRGGR